MTVEEYLEQPFYLSQKIDRKIDKLATLQGIAVSTAASISATPGSGCPNNHKLENLVIKIDDLKSEIKELTEQLIILENEVEEVISHLDDELEQNILIARYIYFEKMEEIGADNNYTVRHVRRIKNNALKKLEENMSANVPICPI